MLNLTTAGYVSYSNAFRCVVQWKHSPVVINRSTPAALRHGNFLVTLFCLPTLHYSRKYERELKIFPTKIVEGVKMKMVSVIVGVSSEFIE
jgi:hypothetical protein